jgi:hypothetical protein
MSSRREKGGEGRLGRLAGTGEGSGGGLPLPDLFSAILNELLDNGPADSRHLTGISASVLEYKSNNVMTTWGSWEALTADALEQLESREIIRSDGDDLWRLSEDLPLGTPVVIIPAGKGRKADSVTIWPREERERLSRANHAEREAASMVGHVRPVDRLQASAIRESVAEVGQLYPVLKDQHGRVLDGGHRLEADPGWKSVTMEVRDDQHALAISLWANRGKELPSKTQSRINQLIGDLAGTNEVRRERIAAELKRDASRSNRQIAELVGASHPTVAEVRQDLENSSKLEERIHRYEFTTAKTGKHSVACWCGEGEAEPRRTSDSKPTREVYDDATREAVIEEARRRLKTGEKTDFRGMAAQFGVGASFAQQMIAVAKERLKAEWQQQQQREATQQTAAAEPEPTPRALPESATDPAPPPWQPATKVHESASPDQEGDTAFNEIVVLVSALEVKTKRRLAAWLLRELPDKDRAAVLSEMDL